jgi:hypothetical protein
LEIFRHACKVAKRNAFCLQKNLRYIEVFLLKCSLNTTLMFPKYDFNVENTVEILTHIIPDCQMICETPRGPEVSWNPRRVRDEMWGREFLRSDPRSFVADNPDIFEISCFFS